MDKDLIEYNNDKKFLRNKYLLKRYKNIVLEDKDIQDEGLKQFIINLSRWERKQTWSLRNISLYSSIGAKLSIFQVKLYESAETPSGSLLKIARLGRPGIAFEFIYHIFAIKINQESKLI